MQNYIWVVGSPKLGNSNSFKVYKYLAPRFKGEHKQIFSDELIDLQYPRGSIMVIIFPLYLHSIPYNLGRALCGDGVLESMALNTREVWLICQSGLPGRQQIEPIMRYLTNILVENKCVKVRNINLAGMCAFLDGDKVPAFKKYLDLQFDSVVKEIQRDSSKIFIENYKFLRWYQFYINGYFFINRIRWRLRNGYKNIFKRRNL